MRIDFKTIDIHNFMAFADESFDFSAFQGMSLIQGKNNDIPGAKNGSGKSSIWSALLYALFGQLQNKIKNENLVNKYSNDKDMMVSLRVDVDKVQYRIRRGVQKGKTSTLILSKIEDGTDIDITKSTIAETQQMLEDDILHCDITMFLRTMLLTADQTYNFYMLKKADKKEFVEKMFDISVFEDMYKAIHKDVLSIDKDTAICQNTVMMLNKKNDEYSALKEKHEAEHAKKIEHAESEVHRIEAEANEARDKVIKPNSGALDELESEMSKHESAKQEATSKLKKLQAALNSAELDIHKLDESRSSRISIASKHKDIVSKLCKDCKAVFVKHYSLDKIANEIKTIDSKKTELSSSKEALAKDLEDAKSIIAEEESSITKIKAKSRELTAEFMKSSQELSRLESSLASARTMLKSAQNETNPYDELMSKCKDELESESSRLSKMSIKSKYLKFAESIVSQDTIRKFIIKDLIVLLNNKIKTYLTKLGAKYYVKFDEDMDYEFITPSGEFEWSNFSAGERMRIMIATSFAFRDFMSIRNGLNANILTLDEYFDSAIDTLCLESIMSILKEYSKSQNQNVFVISHRPEITADQFDNVIVVEKTDNIAHINCTSKKSMV